jgi:formiminotetrahydrofolate cyclodeaminase
MNGSFWDASLASFAADVAAPKPAPAGVAASSIAALLGISLLIKVLEIRGIRPDLLDAARSLAAELRQAAEDDVAAVQRYIQSRDLAGMLDPPMRAARAAVSGLELSSKIEISGLIAADLRAGTELLAGAARAILTCVDSNLRLSPSQTLTGEIATLRQRAATAGSPL